MRKYKVIVDEGAETLTVCANYYTNAQSADSLSRALMFWNCCSDKMYSFRDGFLHFGKRREFRVIFDLRYYIIDNVGDANGNSATPNELLGSASKDPIGCTYILGNPGETKHKNEMRNGVTNKNFEIIIRPQRGGADTGWHEVGHTLGIKQHKFFGIMTRLATSKARTDYITQDDVDEIICRAHRTIL